MEQHDNTKEIKSLENRPQRRTYFSWSLPYIAALIGCLITISSCDWVNQSIKDTNKPDMEASGGPAKTERTKSSTMARTEPTPEASFFTDSMKLSAAQQTLIDLPQFRGKDLYFKQNILFYDYQGGYISLEIQDPNKPENLDTYKYTNGHWGPSMPVNTSGSPHWKRDLVPIGSVRFATVKTINTVIAQQKQNIEGAHDVTHIYYFGGNAVYAWRASIEGARKNYTLKFKPNGDLSSFKAD